MGKKYSDLRLNNYNIDEENIVAHVIIILKHLNEYVLIKNDDENYDFLRFTVSPNHIKEKVNEITKCNFELQKIGYLEETSSKNKYYLFVINVTSTDLQKITEKMDAITINKTSLMKNNICDDIAEIVYKIENRDYVGIFIILVLVISVVLALSILIYSIINGNIRFDLLFGLSLIFLVLLYGFLHYKRNK